ncbi:MAG: hypothetical protein AB7U75_21995 [Hyphomicrobiaceae bacterium]
MAFYMVEITTYAVVMADDESHAHSVADDFKREICSDDWNPRIEVDGAVVKVEDLRHGWDGECIPYGGDGNTTLAALLVPNADVTGAGVFRAGGQDAAQHLNSADAEGGRPAMKGCASPIRSTRL